jgi:hypothetical protein
VRKSSRGADAASGAVLADCPLNQQLGLRREEEEDQIANGKLFTIYSYSLQGRGNLHIIHVGEMLLVELMVFNLVEWSGWNARQPRNFSCPYLI